MARPIPRTRDVAPENVEPGTRRGRIRLRTPKVRDRMAIDPEAPGGFYDQQLFKSLRTGYRAI